jgi:hypothetical protein
VSRILEMVRARPRIFAPVRESYEAWMTDQAWLLRSTASGGVDAFGAPAEQAHDWGPYAAKLSTPSQQERREADRYTTDTVYVLQIASDVGPVDSDRVRVRSDGTDRTYRIIGDVQRRRAAWGDTPVWHMMVAILTEA